MSWEGEKEIQDSLQALKSSKGVSASRIKAIATCALKYKKEYKRVVHAVEHYLWKSEAKYRLAGLYAMDAIIRQAKGPVRDNFVNRFLIHFTQTIKSVSSIPSDQQANVKRVLEEWQSMDYFSGDDIIAAGGQEYVSATLSTSMKSEGLSDPYRSNDNDINHIGGSDPNKLSSLLSILKKQKASQPLIKSPPNPAVGLFESAYPPSASRDTIERIPISDRERTNSNPSGSNDYGVGRNWGNPQGSGYAPTQRLDTNGRRYPDYSHDFREDPVNVGFSPREQPPDRGMSYPYPPRDSTFNGTRNGRSDYYPKGGKDDRFGSGDGRDRYEPTKNDVQQPKRYSDLNFSDFEQRSHGRYGYDRYDTANQPRATIDSDSHLRNPKRKSRWDPIPGDSKSSHESSVLPSPRNNPDVNDRSTETPKHYHNGQEVCLNYQYKRCRFGDDCKYAHVIIADMVDFRKKTKLCANYRNGTCRYGDRCSFAHGENEMRQYPDDSSSEKNKMEVDGPKMSAALNEQALLQLPSQTSVMQMPLVNPRNVAPPLAAQQYMYPPQSYPSHMHPPQLYPPPLAFPPNSPAMETSYQNPEVQENPSNDFILDVTEEAKALTSFSNDKKNDEGKEEDSAQFTLQYEDDEEDYELEEDINSDDEPDMKKARTK